ncbi:hypothetical protein Micbo1qcDRAFT_181442 [Microdochium bolleyi]|uniref:Uncharacterized protein n=1 Tax=Microdochium bolleyi TaxID=196109 RepID=A0A136II76_9PEZI|nr:hypothetical protein Micbo1qcDRAFT_181442 [Microdochium bolleyi]
MAPPDTLRAQDMPFTVPVMSIVPVLFRGTSPSEPDNVGSLPSSRGWCASKDLVVYYHQYAEPGGADMLLIAHCPRQCRNSVVIIVIVVIIVALHVDIQDELDKTQTDWSLRQLGLPIFRSCT